MPSKRIIILILFLIVAAGGAYWFFLAGPGGAEVAAIKQRGTLIVGVHDDARPFASRDSEGNIVGMEPDLASDLAERLGVELQLKTVKEEDRVQALQDGAVDLVLAGMPSRDDLGDLVWLVKPAYYAGGANLLVRMGAGLNSWNQIKGWPVCAVQGAEYNERVANEYGARVVVFRDAAEALRAFDTGDCRALLSDESWLISLLVQPEYADFDVPLSHIEGRHWHAAIRHDQAALHNVLEDAVESWHRSGKIVELEQKWKLRPSEFAARMHNGDEGRSPNRAAAADGQ